ncbi:hypothetical protein DYB26_004316 [Aphanomyces astaci]|uniref:Histidine kinase/HSP90-like ATPase domain-containing protein n=1 Tax=Aphanomyces astaci TaxID=112090 RepID=A0A418FFG2_APHAT|nr:hypothetical protein DYB26_004316 [Aphanomyces astaci]
MLFHHHPRRPTPFEFEHASPVASSRGRVRGRQVSHSPPATCRLPCSHLVQRVVQAPRNVMMPSMVRAFSTADSTPADRHEFQAETRQLLDIVTHSIYTDKEVFVRELISNASDALEKFRHHQAVGATLLTPEVEPKIVITTDVAANTLTIEDTGVGMTKEELVANLGTIARSGSKAFLEQLKTEAPTETTAAATGIIGKFGVGFYSAFMVADKVEVYSASALGDGSGHVWSSDGYACSSVLRELDI